MLFGAGLPNGQNIVTEVLETVSMAALTLTVFFCIAYLIAIGAGLLTSYYMRTKGPQQED